MTATYGTPGCVHPKRRKFGNGLHWCEVCGAVYDGVAWQAPAVKDHDARTRISNLEFQNVNLRARLAEETEQKHKALEIAEKVTASLKSVLG